MNRPIKFRAWDKNGKVMVDWLTFRQKAFNRDDKQLMYDLFTNHRQNFIPMQFTGLLDKNGNEIYEGDYLADDDYSESCRHRIVWYEDQAKFELETWEGEDNWSSGLFDYLADSVGKDNKLEHFEVIGNRFENPELIKKG